MIFRNGLGRESWLRSPRVTNSHASLAARLRMFIRFVGRSASNLHINLIFVSFIAIGSRTVFIRHYAVRIPFVLQ